MVALSLPIPMDHSGYGMIPVTTAASAADMTVMGGLKAEFHYASDNALLLADCLLCTAGMVSTSCDGVVKYGFGDKRSD